MFTHTFIDFSLMLLTANNPFSAPDSIAIPMYLFTNLVGFYLGVFHMVPIVFEGDSRAMLFHRCFITLLCLEMMVNWLGIRYVDSTYTRYLRLYGPPRHGPEIPQKTENLLLASGSRQVGHTFLPKINI